MIDTQVMGGGGDTFVIDSVWDVKGGWREGEFPASCYLF